MKSRGKFLSMVGLQAVTRFCIRSWRIPRILIHAKFAGIKSAVTHAKIRSFISKKNQVWFRGRDCREMVGGSSSRNLMVGNQTISLSATLLSGNAQACQAVHFHSYLLPLDLMEIFVLQRSSVTRCLCSHRSILQRDRSGLST